MKFLDFLLSVCVVVGAIAFWLFRGAPIATPLEEPEQKQPTSGMACPADQLVIKTVCQKYTDNCNEMYRYCKSTKKIIL